MPKTKTKPKTPKARKKTGPKTNWKQSPEAIRKLEEAFALDATIDEACFYADISPDTYYRWIKERPELSERFAALRNKPVLAARQTVLKAIQGGDQDIALKYLERKRSDEFSPKVKQEHSGEVKGGGFQIIITQKKNENGELGTNGKASKGVGDPE